MRQVILALSLLLLTGCAFKKPIVLAYKWAYYENGKPAKSNVPCSGKKDRTGFDDCN